MCVFPAQLMVHTENGAVWVSPAWKTGCCSAALPNVFASVHTRKADHYSGNVLTPLGLPDCIRISVCHYNTTQEIAKMLAAVKEMGGS